MKKFAGEFKEFISKDEIHLEVGPGKGMFITTLAQKFVQIL